MRDGTFPGSLTRVFAGPVRGCGSTSGLMAARKPRAVFVTVKKYGNAIARNRARRVVSECWRLSKHRIAVGMDVVVVIFPGDDSFEPRQRQLEAILTRSALGFLRQ